MSMDPCHSLRSFFIGRGNGGFSYDFFAASDRFAKVYEPIHAPPERFSSRSVPRRPAMTDFLNSDGETFVRSFNEFGPGFKTKIERAVDALLDILEGMDADPDLEETGDDELTGDEEPSLGATHAPDQNRAWSAAQCIEIDAEFDGDTTAECDREPSLGSVERHPNGYATLNDAWSTQENWASGTADDREDEHDGAEPDMDGEPSLAAQEWMTTQNVTARDPDGRAIAFEKREGDQASGAPAARMIGNASARHEGGSTSRSKAVRCD